jgi:CHAT domain-containing protein/lipopolysaccharide biosynthesis regulator YciM
MELVRLAEAIERRGDLEQAQDQYERVLAVGEPPDAVAAALYNLGRLCRDRGELDSAAEHQLRALERAEQIAPEWSGVVAVLNSLALTYVAGGDFEKAQRSFERAVEVGEHLAASEPSVAIVLADTLNGLGSIYLARGDLERARECAHRALELRQQFAPRSPEIGVLLNNLAMLHAEGRDFSTGQQFAERAVGFLEEVAPHSDALALAVSTLGAILRERGALERAEDLTRRALQLFREIDHSEGVATALQDLGTIYRSRGELDRAREHLEAALELHERRAPESRNIAMALSALGSIHRARGDLEAAIRILERAVGVAESLRARAGRTTRAREELFARHQNPYQELIAALAARGAEGDQEAAFGYAERSRARALVDLLAERRVAIRAETDEQRKLLDVERSVQQRLAATYNRLARARTDPGQAHLVPRLGAEQSELETGLEGVRVRIREEFEAYAQIEDPEPVGIKGARALLDAETLLLEYHVTGEETHLWALRRDRSAMFPLGVDADRLEELVTKAVGHYRRAEDASADAEHARGELGELLLAPVPEPVWQGCERLLVVPDGHLHYLPFEILPAPGEPASMLIDGYPVAYFPSITALGGLLKHSVPGAEREFVGFGDPEFDGGGGEAEQRFASRGLALSPLRATRKEVVGIAGGFPGRTATYLGADATEYRAKHETEGVRFVHFSTHGLLDDQNPLYSGLALSPPSPAELAKGEALDDCLQVYEMFELRLSAEAVVCSACETGLGAIRAGEGLVGMTRALLFAGARCVVVSLWPIPNVFTARLMERFYTELQAGQPLAEALRGAKLTVRERYPDPFNWAAFVAVGVAW